MDPQAQTAMTNALQQIAQLLQQINNNIANLHTDLVNIASAARR